MIPAIARFSFSISMFELMSPLTAGGTLVVLDRDHVMDPSRMARTLGDITLFHAGPSLLKHLLPYLDRHHAGEAFANVRHASSGGDLIAPELLATLARIFEHAEIFVIYGSSEIGCMGCTYPVDRAALPARTFVGRPFDDVTVRLLDPAGERVPIGVVGEIHFAGRGVVSGYLDRADLTAERFVARDGERFYGMGDMGRWSLDARGEPWLEILGRNDFRSRSAACASSSARSTCTCAARPASGTRSWSRAWGRAATRSWSRTSCSRSPGRRCRRCAAT